MEHVTDGESQQEPPVQAPARAGAAPHPGGLEDPEDDLLGQEHHLYKSSLTVFVAGLTPAFEHCIDVYLDRGFTESELRLMNCLKKSIWREVFEIYRTISLQFPLITHVCRMDHTVDIMRLYILFIMPQWKQINGTCIKI